MSTTNKTQNYDLLKYVGIKYPLFLKDQSDNMDIIDALIKGINDDIDEIQRVIDTVSTQNIDDLVARILALEVKVDNNANLIQSLLTSLAGLTSEVDKNKNRIAALARELEQLKGDVEILKQCCDSVMSTLVAHGASIAENTNELENINNDIIRIKADVIGNAQDIQTLATQLATSLDNKQDKLIAGTGISIVDNVISSTGGSGNVIGTYNDGNLTLG